MGTGLLVPVVMLVAWFVARARMHSKLLGALVPTGDVRLDVARLEEGAPLRTLQASIGALEAPSVWVPLMGWALVAPLTSHLLFALMVGWVKLPRLGAVGQHDFDVWILASIVLMGVGHAVLCVTTVQFARRLRAWKASSGEKSPSTWLPYAWTMVGATVPGVILYAVPPLIAAVTSLFIPVTFGHLKRRVLTERALLEYDYLPAAVRSALNTEPMSSTYVSEPPRQL